MTKLKTILLATAVSTGTAMAGTYDQSSNYNGMTGTSMNAPVNSSLRDANGNLEVVDGKITSSTYGAAGGGVGFNPGTGVGGVGGSTNTATAIGNQLNVVTMGSNNIVIVDSTQINNGDQSATNNTNN